MSAELNARRTAAAAVLADFRRWAVGETVSGDWQSHTLRLATELRSLLAQLDAEPVPDLAGLRLALADAIDYREARASDFACTACESHPSGLCEAHAGDLDMTDAYIALGRQLGIEVDR